MDITNDWQRMVDSEEIKLGEKVVIEFENGKTEKMKLIKYDEDVIYLRNNKKEIVEFSPDTLESFEDINDLYGTIIGKA